MINLKDKNILVTGSNGFIGRHLANYLLKNGLYKKLTLIDISERPMSGETVTRIKSSFNEWNLTDKILDEQDVVFHLAAMVGVYNCLNNKDELVKINLHDTKTFIDKVIQHGCDKIVFSSSSEIYGNSNKLPYSEVDAPTPVSEYARYKVEIEKYLLEKTKSSDFSATVVRFFNVYGCSQRTEFVVSKFIDMAKCNHDLVLNGDGLQTRSFTFVEDAVQGLILAMQYDQAKYEIFNIGNNRELTILSLATSVLSHIPDSKSKIIFLNKENANRYDFDRRVPAIVKAQKILGFNPRVELEEGLKKIIYGE